MPVQSLGEQPARPTPEAALPLPLLQHKHQPQSPASFKSLRRSHNEHTGAKKQRCKTGFYILLWNSTSPLSVSLWVTATLPFCTLRNFPQHTATPQPPALLHTDSLGETDTEKRGRKEGERGCYLVALSLCYLSSPFYERFTTEGTAEYMWIHVQPLSLSHTDIHKDSHITHTQKEGGNRAVDVSRGWTRCERQQWKHEMLLPQAYKHTAC